MPNKKELIKKQADQCGDGGREKWAGPSVKGSECGDGAKQERPFKD